MVGDDIAKYDLSTPSGDAPPVGTFSDYRIASGSTFLDWVKGELYCYNAESQSWQEFGGDG